MRQDRLLQEGHAVEPGARSVLFGAALIAVTTGTVAFLGGMSVWMAFLAYVVSGAISVVGLGILSALLPRPGDPRIERRVGPDGIAREVPREWLEGNIPRPVTRP